MAVAKEELVSEGWKEEKVDDEMEDLAEFRVDPGGGGCSEAVPADAWLRLFFASSSCSCVIFSSLKG